MIEILKNDIRAMQPMVHGQYKAGFRRRDVIIAHAIEPQPGEIAIQIECDPWHVAVGPKEEVLAALRPEYRDWIESKLAR